MDKRSKRAPEYRAEDGRWKTDGNIFLVLPKQQTCKESFRVALDNEYKTPHRKSVYHDIDNAAEIHGDNRIIYTILLV